ncbi:urease accessory protein UreD [Corynebacterium tapiri]|uniref:Urease accessory protein UreD n=2 Tax=Corynebacterium tapiri TaxID=1448266 RepID=A0A5C4U4A7_9CORY|nr:urease accessory protein UreD [Corynebacterium tapiri]
MEHAASATGSLQLKIALQNHGGGTRSYAAQQFHQGALRVLRPLYLDSSGQVTYHVINPGGAYFGGDNYELDVTISAGASLLLTTQSATKVYKTPGQPAVQTMRVHVGAEATFDYLPDQLIVYRDGTYKQSTVVEVEETSQVIMGEIITPGWSPAGESFAYDGAYLRTEVRFQGAPYVVDQVRFLPHDGDMTGIGMMEGYSHAGQLLLLGTQVLQHRETIAALARESDAHVGLSSAGAPIPAAPPCLAVRSLAHSTEVLMGLHSQIAEVVRGRPIPLTRF